VAIFGRITARQRLRRATRESLAIPAFSSPIDCTPWVTGGLWPAELSTAGDETATVAEYLRTDLERIANSANDELKMLKRAGMSEPARLAAEARVIDEARARAERRVESAIRHLHAMKNQPQVRHLRPPVTKSFDAELDATQVMPAVTEAEPVTDLATARASETRRGSTGRRRRRAAGREEREAKSTADEAAGPLVPDIEETQVIPVVREVEPGPSAPLETAPEPPKATDGGRHHLVADEPPAAADSAPAVPDIEETQVIPVVIDVEPPRASDSGRHHVIVDEPPVGEDEPAPYQIEKPSTARDFDVERLNRLLEFVVRQEPRLNWAIGDRADGTTVLVTDLAHGWIPSGVALPAGVRLLEPERRTGKVSALIGDTVRVVTYAPGDSLRRSADFAATKSSLQPRGLPPIEDLPTALSEATRRRDGLPRIVRRLIDAAAAGTGVVDQEVDVLRVQLDTARYQLLVQYPDVNPALLLNCLLLAATEGIASGDAVSANYHLAWYQKLAAATPGMN
jgi:uncharacterized protein DUF5631/uncharacterized protein DUF5632